MASISLVSSTDPAAQGSLQELNRRLAEFYNRPAMTQYFTMAQEQNEVWAPGTYHAVLRELARRGMSVLDLGCGSGHAYANLKQAGVEYTGVDWSEEQVRRNQAKYDGAARFVAAPLYATGLPDAAFDMVFSLFVLEHLVWPRLFLEEAVRITKPGGLIAIICPDFRPAGRMPSLPHGGPGSMAQKIKSLRWTSAMLHAWYRFHWPRTIARLYPKKNVPFLINLQPRCFVERYATDNDAVYFVDRSECVRNLAELGAADETAQVLSNAKGQPRADGQTCFIVARRCS